jgi:hypothetical protein
MTIVTITGASKLARVSRGTIYNKIESGELSKGPDGIDSTELLRVFGRLYHPDAGVNDVKVTKSGAVSDVSGVHGFSNGVVRAVDDDVIEQLAWMRDLVEKRDSVIAEKERQLAEAQKRLDEREDFWAGQVSKMQALLPAPEVVRRKRFLGIF